MNRGLKGDGNSRSTTDILFYDVFEIPENPGLVNVVELLVQYYEHEARVQWRIILPMKIGDKEPYNWIIMAEFMIVQMTLVYNGINGRPSIYDLNGAVFPYYHALKFSLLDGKGIASSETEVAELRHLLSTEGKKQKKCLPSRI